MPLFILDTDHVSLFQRAHPVVHEHVLALPFGSVVTTIVTVEEQLRGRIRIGTYDLRIAAIVLTNEGVLVTGNARDFSQVPGLKFEDWSVG